ncbi:MAG TPA: hypothetical protein VKA34_05280 [Balneolales bacterium]|nr:hypothetical protein [Balneolales bacterium]
MSEKNLDNTKGQQPDDEIYEIEVEQKFADSVEEGVTDDSLDMKRLAFWVLTGLCVVFLLVTIAYNMYGYNSFEMKQQIDNKTKNYEITQKRAEEHKILTSYGIVNLKEGIYRIPIDSAISLYVKENKNSNTGKSND